MSMEPGRIPKNEVEEDGVGRLGHALRAGDTVQHFAPVFGDPRGVDAVVGFHDGKVLVRDHRHERIYTHDPGNVERQGE